VIVVVGSVNMDVIATVDHLPRPGETIIAVDHANSHGGKGANQAVAAARLGADVHFVGCVGDDVFGDELRSGLAAEGVDVGCLRGVAGSSGTAIVTVDGAGENTIVVGSGANQRLTLSEGDLDLVGRASIVLCQLEVPLQAVAAAATATSGLFVLNAAPAERLPADLLADVDVLVVNEHELSVVAGSMDVDAVRALGVATVVTTLGGRGAQVVTSWDIGYIPAIEVPVLDTTGAGDAFCGALAASLDSGSDVFAAAARATVAGSLATTRIGARTGMPDLEALESAIARRP